MTPIPPIINEKGTKIYHKKNKRFRDEELEKIIQEIEAIYKIYGELI